MADINDYSMVFMLSALFIIILVMIYYKLSLILSTAMSPWINMEPILEGDSRIKFVVRNYGTCCAKLTGYQHWIIPRFEQESNTDNDLVQDCMHPLICNNLREVCEKLGENFEFSVTLNRSHEIFVIPGDEVSLFTIEFNATAHCDQVYKMLMHSWVEVGYMNQLEERDVAIFHRIMHGYDEKEEEEDVEKKNK